MPTGSLGPGRSSGPILGTPPYRSSISRRRPVLVCSMALTMWTIGLALSIAPVSSKPQMLQPATPTPSARRTTSPLTCAHWARGVMAPSAAAWPRASGLRVELATLAWTPGAPTSQSAAEIVDRNGCHGTSSCPRSCECHSSWTAEARREQLVRSGRPDPEVCSGLSAGPGDRQKYGLGSERGLATPSPDVKGRELSALSMSIMPREP
jgi:hypothetical protein